MLTFLVEPLATALHAVNAPLRGTLFSGARWQYAGDLALRLTGNNLETAISLAVAPTAPDGEMPLDIVVPFLCAEWLATLPAGETVTLAFDAATQRLTAQVAGDTATFACRPGTDYPALPDVGGDALILDSAQLRAALNAVLPAASTDQAQYVLAGVYFCADGDRLTLAAANGYRLAEYQLPLSAPVTEAHPLILPAASLKELVKLLPKTDQEEVTLAWNSAQAQFAWDTTVLCARRIDGNYPAYQCVIAAARESALNSATVNRAALEKAIKCAAVFARENARILQLTLTGTDIRVRAEGAGIGDGATTLPLTAPAPAHEFFVNAQFCADGVKAVPGDTVTLHYAADAHQAVYLTGGDAPYLHLVMPMQVRQ
ncbi:MAG TPA: DNA polymerase III subunit beta [Anaerolineae bacterium]|nr:DNA polymerase III subunit beta [Anaerolineae bacterium]